MNWIDRDIEYFFCPTLSNLEDFFEFLKEELEGVDVDCGVFSGIYTIDDGIVNWFEEKIVQRFEKDIREKVNIDGCWIKMRLKYLYSVGESEGEKIFLNGESLFGD